MNQFNTTIDSTLINQARQLTGMNSYKALVEYALRIVIALQSVPPTPTIKPSAMQRIGKASERLSPSTFKTVDSPPIYQGKSLSLEDMQAAIEHMAIQQK